MKLRPKAGKPSITQVGAVKSKKTIPTKAKVLEEGTKFSADIINALLEERKALMESEKSIGQRRSEINEQIKEIAELQGTTNSKGSKIYLFDARDGVTYSLAKVRKASSVLNVEAAKRILKAKYAKTAEKVILSKVYEVIDEEALAKAVTSKLIKQSDFDAMMDTKEQFSTSVAVYRPEEEEQEQPKESKITVTERSTTKTLPRRR